VERPDEIVGAIQQALAAEAPAVVEVMTGLHYRAPAPWTPAS
jgi:thiamine pyrophosphate-dependent acetolactate synthase large subunit-like protein